MGKSFGEINNLKVQPFCLSIPCCHNWKVLLIFTYFDDEGQTYYVLSVCFCSALQAVEFSFSLVVGDFFLCYFLQPGNSWSF